MNLFSQNDSRVTPIRTELSITVKLNCNDGYKTKKMPYIIVMQSDNIDIAKHQAI